MKTKQGSPSGVGSRIYAATKFKPISLTELGFSQSVLRLLMVLLVLPMAWVRAWGGSTWMTASSKNTAAGLVYSSTSSSANPKTSDYTSPSQSDSQSGGGSNVAKDFYIWAKPARGFYFSGWSDKGGQTKELPSTNTGNGDKIQGTTPRQQDVASTVQANFQPLTAYEVTYAQPVGGSYSVEYKYLTIDATTVHFVENTETLELTPTSGDLKPEGNKSYATDAIKLSTSATNFIGWKKNGVVMSTANPYTGYAPDADATISAEFKEIGWGNVFGDLTVNATAKDTYGGKKIYIACPMLIGEWVDGDFTIEPKNANPEAADAINEYGSIKFGSVHLDAQNNRLEIPYSYTATNWGGISVDVTITPAYGEPKQFTIACNAEEVVGYDACIEESGVRTYTGTLAAMMMQANSMNNKPTLKLMNPVTITSPLSFTQSFTFDVNGKVLTANCASAFSIDAAGVDVQIIDGSFTQVGEIHTSYASSGNVNVVTFTKAAKLTMQGGTLSVENTGTGSAYGVDVQQGSIFYMTGGDLTVTASTGNARGANIATTSDYATFNGGSITVSAPTNAYGMWSAGQSNITNATISVEATTGANAYGVYVNGGTSTIGATDFTVNSKTTNAHGANVNAGRLNVNGGSFAAAAVEDKVYGIYVASGATAMAQMKATITASVTTGNGTANVEVCGVHNMGTASLSNISVTATNNSTTATASTNYVAAVSTFTGAVSTTIEDGTYTANAETGYAYAIRHRNGTLNVDGGTYKGILKTSGVGAFGAHLSANATIANATLLGETRGSGSKAHGVVGSAGTITLTNCELTGLSNTNIAYSIYSRTNVSATGCTLTATTLGSANVNNGAEAYGFHAETGTNSLTNCNATVTSNTIKAYGVNHVAGSLTVTGGRYNVEAKQGTSTGAENAEVYGIRNESGLTTTVNGAKFYALASHNGNSKYAYGAYISGALNSIGAVYNARAKEYVRGVLGYSASTLNLTNDTITSTTTNGKYSYGIYAKKNFTINGVVANAVGSSTDVYAMFFDATNSKGDVLSGKFSAQGNGTNGYGALNAGGTVGNVRLKGGVYKTTLNLQKYAYTGYQLYHLDETHPDYAGGYRYTIAAENPSPYVCRIVGGAYYATLKEALQYTLDNSGNYTIVMTQNHTLPAGEYVLPANATLIVPRTFGQTTITNTPTNNPDPAQPDRRNTVGLCEEFLRLTMASDAHLSVSGKIGVSGEMYCQESGYISYNNSPYGHILMEEGSLIQLNDGARLYAWGFISGAGNITAKSNAEVHEMFQVGDMQTVGNLADGFYGNSHKHFLINQYSIHNVAVPTTYYHNSRLICAMFNYYNGTGNYQGGHNILIVGTSGALFEVTSNDESSWVRKSYDAAHDLQVWDVNSSAQLGSIDMTIASQNINSLNYILPITSNMKIHILDGDFIITQSTEFLPGSSIEVDKTASLTINQTYKDGNNQTQNLKVYVFDKDQWPLSTTKCSPVYSPAWPNGSKPSRTIEDAAINVHGNINVEGALYTTNSLAGGTNTTHGANIYSNNADAGTISFVNAAPTSTTSITLITGVSNHSLVTKEVTMDPALLKNGTGASQAFTPTSGTDEEHAFAYINNEWQETYTNGCFEVKGTTVYAKPSGYVALKKTQEGDYGLEGVEEANHTYLTANDKILILMPGCQWWEVEETSDSTVFECKKPGYEGFYYYDNSDPDPEEWNWKLKTVNVTFYMKEEGTDANDKVIVTDFNGIPDQAVIASNPTKATTPAATYQFKGWKSSVTGTEYPWTATLEEATADMNYRPVFTETPRNYTVTFKDANNGADMPVETAYNTHPTCTPVKDATAQYTYYFQYWLDSDGVTQYAIDAELPTVTGATYYTAVWTQTTNKYTVTWKNGDDVLETDPKQVYGTAVSYDGTTPTKEQDNNFKYKFDGWSLTDGGEKLTSLPSVNGDLTFYAHYTTTPRYAITFANYDGTQLQKEPVTAGEHPIYNGLTPGRARDLDGYFKFIGWKDSEGEDFEPTDELPAVTGKETYTAQYDYVTELYLITLNNVDGAGASWSGKFGVGSIPFYNRDNNDVAVEPTKASTTQYEYTFSGWEPALVPVAGVATYTAQFGQSTRKYNITFANLDGNGAHQTIEVEYGTTPVCPVTPSKVVDHTTYAFKGWNTQIVAVTGEATYTAQFSSTGVLETFPITFDPDNGVDAPYVVNVAYGETPTPEDPATWQDAANTYTFSGWTPAIHAVDGPAEYTAQYTPTLRTYTIRFVNYDGTELRTSVLAYGTTPVPPTNMTKPANFDTKKMYNFNGWSPAIASVTGDATYTAQYTEQNLAATVTIGDVTTPYTSWDQAYGNRANNCIMKLYANVTPGNNYRAIDRDMTIDLNGYTISGTGDNSSSQLLNVTKALTIIDSRGSSQNGKVSYTGSGRYTYTTINISGNGASLTLNGGIIEATNTRTSNNNNGSTAARAVATASSAALTINGGELVATSSKGNAHVVYNNGTNVTITGGKLKASGSATLNIFNTPGNVTASAATETCYFSKDPGSITVVDGYEKRTPAGISGYTHKVVRVYTVTFQNRGGAVLQNTPKYEAGETPTYSGETPTYYTSEGTKLYTFRAWKAEGDENEYTTSFPAVIGAITYVAQYDELEQLEVEDNTPIEKDIEVTNTVVSTTGVLNTNGHTLTTTNLILEAGVDVSGQITDGSNVSVSGNVYYDLKLNTDARHWHAFGVPWNVDVTEHAIIEVETGRTLVVGRDCEIVYYNGATRAAQGAGSHCWNYLKHYTEAGQPVDVMTPGKGYMIAFTSAVQTVRFTKATGAPIFFSGSNNVVGGDGENGGWNAIANPMAYHATLSAGPTVGYVHDGGEIGSDGYTPYDINGTRYIVGKTVYVQAGSNQTIVVNPAGTAGDMTEILAAPKRAKAESVTDKQYLALGDYYTVSLTNANGVGSKVYVLPEEDKADEYVIGHDLSQFSMSTKKPQVWVNRYDTKLALNTTAPISGVADFPISLYAPVAGEYTITNDQSPMTNDEEYTVYLTLNGEAIWNLSSSAYALSLSKGTVSNYGIRISAKVPQVATGMDEAVIDAQGETRKVLIEDKVFIIRGNNVYSVDGQLVK